MSQPPHTPAPQPRESDGDASLRERLAFDAVRARLQGGKRDTRRCGRYILRKQIGRGGMGDVFRAWDPQLQRDVALKVLRPGVTGTTGRLEREARSQAILQDPNVVRIFDVGTSENCVYITMELVEGTTLRSWRVGKGRSVHEVLDLYLRAANGLHAAHERGLIHRDFKPGNVLVDADGNPKIADFGLAVQRATYQPLRGAAELNDRLDTRLTRSGVTMGTPRYMAPEQHLGASLDARTDQYAFCIALFEALTGTPPFGGTTAAALFRSKGAAPHLPPTFHCLPKAIRQALLRGLSPEPRDRFADMRELQAALQPRQRSRRIFRGRRGAMVAGLVAMLAAAAQPGRDSALANAGPPAIAASSAALGAPNIDADLATVSALTARGRGASARHLASRILADAEARGSSRLQAKALLALSNISLKLGSAKDAVPLLKRAYFAAAEDGAHDLAARIAVRTVFATAKAGDIPEGHRWIRHAQAELANGDRPHLRAVLHRNTGVLHQADGRFEDAAREAEQAASLAAEASGPRSLDVAISMSNLGVAQLSLDRPEAAHGPLATASRIYEAHDVRDRNYAVNELNLGLIAQRAGDCPGATQHYTRAREATDQTGPRLLEHGLIAMNLAACMLSDTRPLSTANLDHASQLLADARRILAEALDEAHPTLLLVDFNEALATQRRGDAVHALSRYEAVWVGQVDALGPESIAVARTEHQLGVLLAELENPTRAAQQLEHAARVYRTVYGPENERTQEVEHDLRRVASNI